MKPTDITIKKLFALSGNRCAFPGCTFPIFDRNSGVNVGEICHIKAENEGGPRYDLTQTEDERRDYPNLILMCGVHHKIIDTDMDSYTVERLQQIKKVHEQCWVGKAPAGFADIDVVKSLIETLTRIHGDFQFSSDASASPGLGLIFTYRPKFESQTQMISGNGENLIQIQAKSASVHVNKSVQYAPDTKNFDPLLEQKLQKFARDFANYRWEAVLQHLKDPVLKACLMRFFKEINTQQGFTLFDLGDCYMRVEPTDCIIYESPTHATKKPRKFSEKSPEFQADLTRVLTELGQFFAIEYVLDPIKEITYVKKLFRECKIRMILQQGERIGRAFDKSLFEISYKPLVRFQIHIRPKLDHYIAIHPGSGPAGAYSFTIVAQLPGEPLFGNTWDFDLDGNILNKNGQDCFWDLLENFFAEAVGKMKGKIDDEFNPYA